MILVNELKPGLTFKDNENLYSTLEINRNKTARGKMVMKVRAKNLRSGGISELSYTAGDKVESVYLDKRDMLYLYDDGANLIFMDNVNFEQVFLNKSNLEWELNFLIPNQSINITYYEKEILGVDLPLKLTLQIVECEPAVKGDTVNKAMKDATLETGFIVKVPLFVQQDDKIVVRTDTGEYDSRA